MKKEEGMVSLLQLFWSFFKIGTFTIGGGFAMIPLMEKELVDRHQWLSSEEFMDILALAQTMPGIFAANMATHVGWRLRGIARAVVALIAAPVFRMAAAALLLVSPETFGTYSESPLQFFLSIGLFAAAFFASLKWKTSPILLIVLAGVVGFVVYYCC